jgi:hypothetical protein
MYRVLKPLIFSRLWEQLILSRDWQLLVFAYSFGTIEFRKYWSICKVRETLYLYSVLEQSTPLFY